MQKSEGRRQNPDSGERETPAVKVTFADGGIDFPPTPFDKALTNAVWHYDGTLGQGNQFTTHTCREACAPRTDVV